MREWLSGGVSPCQGEGRGFESRLALNKKDGYIVTIFFMFARHGRALTGVSPEHARVVGNV